ncbi:hypothetical protein [Devosia sp. Leaf64]|uniref:hypothetical protein n=1 Tax=Devosia sp. Leaf64 TaxID=1736229 RepID=UPI000712FD07|nr:hypothetical protein [Devosia sp. Leaf64]KQN71542.1 hypothetical protein ASE94_10870 [Devosia sp. Leaf64]
MVRQDLRALLLLIAGFTVWSLAFVVLYGLQALGCAYGWPNHRWLLIGAYVASLIPLAWLAMGKPVREGEPTTTLSIAALWANRAALGAGILVFLPVTFVSACI